jgi:hypothetical protein
MSTITTPVILTNAPIVIISHLLCAHPHPCLNNLPEDNVHPSRAIENSGSLQTHKNATDAKEKENKKTRIHHCLHQSSEVHKMLQIWTRIFCKFDSCNTKTNGKEKGSAKIRSTQNRNSQTKYVKSGREAFAKVQQLAARWKHQMDGEEEKV